MLGVMVTRARLNRVAVVEMAEALVDREGWQYLTMTALAKKLGVQVPSLYNHVESLDDVVCEVQVRAHEELGKRLQRAAMGRVGADAVRTIAAAVQEFVADHPGLYDLAMTEPIDEERIREASEPSGAALGAVISSFGVMEPSNEVFMSFVATLHGVVALSHTRLFGDSVEVSSVYERAVDLVVRLLEDERTK
jgi:AcrR family transcriptional regulator